MKKIIITSVVFFTLLVPSLSFIYAQTPPAPGGGSGVVAPGGGSGISNTVTLKNPLSPQYSSIPLIVGALLNVVEYIGAIACALWIIWAGFSFVKARGNSEELSKAKLSLLHAVIGTLIILAAGAILTVIQSIITAIKS
jgi:hypothetical protein